MAWTSPDKGEGDNDIQSIMFQEYWDVLVAGISGLDCVLSGCAVTGGADMTPSVAKGAVLSNGTMFAVTLADVTITAADATNPRIDLIVINNAGGKAVRAGTPAAAPKPPARSANDVVLAHVFVPANDTSIETTKCIDMRMPPPRPITIYTQTTQRVQNNSAAAVSLFSNAAGVTIPNGLFLAGRILRVRAGGNILHNTTTAMTLTVIISYGGTTIYNDVSVSYGTTADADRGAWWLEFDLIAAANAVQRMGGFMLASAIAPGAATTGVGDLAVDEIAITAPIGSATGGIAVDSDAADRILNVTFTMSAASASHEWACNAISVELL